jgi:hypothetical protein
MLSLSVLRQIILPTYRPFQAISVDPTALELDGGATTTYSDPSFAIGAAPAVGQRRYVFMLNSGIQDGTDQQVASTTLAGITMTQLCRASNLGNNVVGTDCAAISVIEVTTGTTATIATTFSGSMDAMGLSGYAVYTGPQGLDFSDYKFRFSNGDPSTIHLPVYAGGLVLLIYQNRNGGANTWTLPFGGTEDQDGDINSSDHITTASYIPPCTQSSMSFSVTCGTPDDAVLLGVSLKAGR